MLPEGTSRMSLAGKPVYQYGHVATYASRTVVAESSAIPSALTCRSTAPR